MSAKTISLVEQIHKLIPIPEEVQGLKVLMVFPEIPPYASVGGVGQVGAYLSKALASFGNDVKLFMPKYGLIDEEKYTMEMVVEGLKVPTGEGNGTRELVCNVKTHKTEEGIQVFFLENMEYYEKRANVYGYSDDPVRWALLSRGVLEFLRHYFWKPDIIHCNDWQTGLIPNFLKTVYTNDPDLSTISSVYTIHNLQYQGMFDPKRVSELDFDDGKSPIASFFSSQLKKQNFMRRGIIYADVVNTVSETYSREILTSEYGEGLDKLLTELRSKLFGVVNGIDYERLNPQTDPLIPANFNISSLERRSENKLALQKEFNLPGGQEKFVCGVVARLVEQKGLDLVIESMWHFLHEFDAQLVVVGGGDGNYIEALEKLKEEYPDKVGLHLMPNFTLPRLVFAGSDVFLMPSKFEPSGLTQLEAMRYGAVPIVRATGGLADTVEDFDFEKDLGTGFVFRYYSRWAFFAQLVRAYENFRHKPVWQKLQKRAMSANFSWERSAKRYIELYTKAVFIHSQEGEGL